MSSRPESPDYRAQLKRALIAVDRVQSKLDRMQRARTEPLAIIGMGCRMPGGADTPEAFWRLMQEGTDTVAEVPRDRFDVDAYYDPDPEAPGKMSSRYGAFLGSVGQFDAQFFGISPREATTLDPQQRLLMETAWEALERAGLAPHRLQGSPTGVFVGICGRDYAQLVSQRGLETIDAYVGTGNAHSVASGRLSFLLGLRGPSVTVDTACSSSLVAIHQACQSLRGGECDLALAGGVNLVLAPQMSVTLSKTRMLSPDGRCKTFDASANGFGRGEGCGIIVLKRLSDAQASGDRVLAVIRGSAINHDGHSSGLTVPSGPAQQDVIRRALANGNVSPADVSYIEAHGTGTALGDPIEIEALSAVFGADRTDGQPLLVGSVKTNIGHLEGAAGIAGLIKLVLAFEHGEIPPHLHFKNPSPHINWDATPITIPIERTQWQTTGGPRLAGVSSFGFSGTNVHVVLEEAPVEEPVNEPERPQRRAEVLTLSAKTPQALKELAGRFERHLSDHPEEPLEDVCCTASSGRSHFAHRLAVVAGSVEEAKDRLSAFAHAEKTRGVFHGTARIGAPPKVAFLFAGPGTQYAGMGRGLYESQPTFRSALDRCDEILRPLLDRSLLSITVPGPDTASLLNQTLYAQPALFALEYALAELWQSWGIRPAAVLGHSVGEYVAACVAGVFSLEDGLRLVAAQSRLAENLPGDGRMIAVLAEPSLVRDVVRGHSGDIALAAFNGPRQVVVAGRPAPLDALVASLHEKGIRTRQLPVPQAIHSPLVEPVLAEFERECRKIKYHRPTKGIISGVLGKAAGDAIATPEYWCRHLREPVLFADGVHALGELGCDAFLEIGPKPTLLGLASRCLPEASALWLASLRQGRDDWGQMLDSLARLYTHGAAVDWCEFGRDARRHKILLPTYPFQRQQHWVATESPSSEQPVPRHRGKPLHPLLGFRLPSAGEEILFETELSAAEPGYLQDHRVLGTPILPASALVEMALAAGQRVFGGGLPIVEDLAISQALPLPPGVVQNVQVVLSGRGPDTWLFRVLSRSGQTGQNDPTWTLHASGRLLAGKTAPVPVGVDPTALQDACSEPRTAEDHYRRCRDWGIDYGPYFQGIVRLGRGQAQALGEIHLPESLAGEEDQYHVHPALLDACFQVLATAVPQQAQGGDTIYLPVSVKRFRLYQSPGRVVWSHVRLLTTDLSNARSLTVDVRVTTPAGEVVAEAEGMVLDAVRVGAATVDRSRSQGPGGDRPMAAKAPRRELLDQLRSASPEDRQRLLADYIRQQLADVLEIEPLKVDLQQPLNMMGLDSLMAFELQKQVETELGFELPMVLLLEGVCVSELATQLGEQLADSHAADAATAEDSGPVQEATQAAGNEDWAEGTL